MAASRMTKTQLQVTLAEETGTDRKTAGALLSKLVEIAYRETRKNGEFTIPGIGKLVKQKRKARTGRNPKTGEPLKIAAKTVVKLRMAKAAKDAVLGAAVATSAAGKGKTGGAKKSAPASKGGKAAPAKAPAGKVAKKTASTSTSAKSAPAKAPSGKIAKKSGAG